jgi:hypothetical protein
MNKKTAIGILTDHRRSESGFSVVEMAVASFIALIFMLTAGSAYLVNQKAYKRNDEKRQLQQTVAQAMEIMERKVRSAAEATIPAPPNNNRITLLDRAGGTITTFRLQTVGSTDRLFEQSALLAQQKLIGLTFVPNSDTTKVIISLNLQDGNYNKVAMRSTATLRNHRKLRNRQEFPTP